MNKKSMTKIEKYLRYVYETFEAPKDAEKLTTEEKIKGFINIVEQEVVIAASKHYKSGFKDGYEFGQKNE